MNGSHNRKLTKARCATSAATIPTFGGSPRVAAAARPQAGAQRLDAIGRPLVPENFLLTRQVPKRRHERNR